MAENGIVKNGSFLIITDGGGDEVVLVKRKDGALWELPGGGIDRGELPRHAAQSEAEEESGAVTDEETYQLIAIFAQRPYGVAFLYETKKYKGSIGVSRDNTEVSEARIFPFKEILAMGEAGVRTAALRMILRWKRCKLKMDSIPYEGRLSEPVELPRDLNDHLYSELVLRV